MDQRISLITLAVADMDAATAFYKSLGWTPVDSPDGVVAFDLLGQTIGLYPKSSLAQDMGVDAAEMNGISGITLGHNVANKEDVAPIYEANSDPWRVDGNCAVWQNNRNA